MNFEHVIECHPIIEYVEGLVGKAAFKVAKRSDYVVNDCPFCKGDSQFSMHHEGLFICHASACGRQGTDVLSLVMQLHGCNKLAAAKILGGKEDPHGDGPVFLNLANLPLPKVGETVRLRRHGIDKKTGLPKEDWMFEIHAVHVYRKPSGHPHQVILRTEGPDKKGKHRKWFAHLRWDGSDWWTHKHDNPTPLYNLPALMKFPDHQVLIVEGEKDADAAAQALRKQKVVVTTWQGGTDSWTTTDWEPLIGRRVFGWPDADAPGMQCMKQILGHLHEIGCTEISEVEITPGDLADHHSRGAADIKSRGMLKWLKSRVQPFVAGGTTVLGSDSPDPDLSPPSTEPEPPVTPEPAPDTGGHDKAYEVLCDEMELAGIAEAEWIFCPVSGCPSLVGESLEREEFWLRCGLGHTGQEMFNAAADLRNAPRMATKPEPKPEPEKKEEKEKKKRKRRKKAEPPPDEPEPEKVFIGKEELRKRMLHREDSNFVILGSDGGVIYFLLKDSGQILSYTPAGLMNHRNLCTLDSPDWWKKVWGGSYIGEDGETKTIGWHKIELDAGHAMAKYALAKPFDPLRIRGRGAWLEKEEGKKGNIVYNTGGDIYVGQEVRDGHFWNGFVYTPGFPLPLNLDECATDDEAMVVLQILDGCSWEESSSALLLAGWIAIAPIGGCLPWRPHVWFAGNSGVGKSCIRNKIVAKCLGPYCLPLSATNTTEAGVRQSLKNDSLPVLLDECEPKNNTHNKTNALMDLARASSSGDVVRKGSPSGKAVAFLIKSPFLFSAINPTALTQADDSRISKLVLRRSTEEEFQTVQALYEKYLTPEFSRRLVSRCVKLAPVILQSIPIFSDAALRRYGTRRIADQLGTMLAGAYSLMCSEVVTRLRAQEIVQDLRVEQSEEQMNDNEAGTITEYLGAYVVSIAEGKGQQKATINELLDVLSRYDDSDAISKPVAAKYLMRHGMRVETNDAGEKEIWVAVKHPTLKDEVFEGRAWAGSYADHLRNSFGGKRGDRRRFGPGRAYPRVIIPIDTMLSREDGGDAVEPERVHEEF